MTPALLSPNVRVEPDAVEVRSRIGFSASIPRSAVTDARREPRRRWSRGVHGWRGRWLVNGSSRSLVTLSLDPAVRARVLGVPVTLRELTVDVDDPDALVAELTASR